MKRDRGKQLKLEPGTVVKIPMGGQHTYARALNYGDYAFYDLKTNENVEDLNKIITRPVLFKAIVNSRGLIEGFWQPIGVSPLEPELQNSIYYWAGPVDLNQFRISENDVIRSATKDECVGLPVHAIWDPIHIEQRLKDHYDGNENIALKMLDVLENYKLKK